MLNEDIDETYKQYPQQARLFEASHMKKINAEIMHKLVTQPLEQYLNLN